MSELIWRKIYIAKRIIITIEVELPREKQEYVEDELNEFLEGYNISARIESEITGNVYQTVEVLKIPTKDDFEKVIKPYIPQIKEDIAKSSDDKARYKIEDVIKMMGPIFGTVSYSDIYWGLKFILYGEDIIVDSGKAKDDSKLLIFQLKK